MRKYLHAVLRWLFVLNPKSGVDRIKGPIGSTIPVLTNLVTGQAEGTDGKGLQMHGGRTHIGMKRRRMAHGSSIAAHMHMVSPAWAGPQAEPLVRILVRRLTCSVTLVIVARITCHLPSTSNVTLTHVTPMGTGPSLAVLPYFDELPATADKSHRRRAEAARTHPKAAATAQAYGGCLEEAALAEATERLQEMLKYEATSAAARSRELTSATSRATPCSQFVGAAVRLGLRLAATSTRAGGGIRGPERRPGPRVEAVHRCCGGDREEGELALLRGGGNVLAPSAPPSQFCKRLILLRCTNEAGRSTIYRWRRR